VLTVWAKERGLIKSGTEDTICPESLTGDDLKHRRDQSQLYLLLYIETLVSNLAPTRPVYASLIMLSKRCKRLPRGRWLL
jgi:hypothetical protein